MSLIPYYLQYLSEICEGTRQAPEGLALSEQDDLKKALQLQAGIAEMGIPAFVRACAAQDGTEIPQSDYYPRRAAGAGQDRDARYFRDFPRQCLPRR
mgnify:CR=1 FL=1